MAWDDDLFIDYKWDFEGWTKELFSKVERGTLRSLKSVLRHRGVYTGNNHARVADSLYNILGIENTLEWEPAEFRAMKFDQHTQSIQLYNNHRKYNNCRNYNNRRNYNSHRKYHSRRNYNDRRRASNKSSIE
ncbi:hypothetical protein A1F99_023880 [Pyrenophora tritici-repentis]|nr:hypothetical protein A1F99_023880 [Pyrenophora tritici-repentis]